jgi:hypothetical protein
MRSSSSTAMARARLVTTDTNDPSAMADDVKRLL